MLTIELMSRRFVPLISGQTYHLFNRSVAKQPIFTSSKEFQRFLDVVDFYRFKKPAIRFSYYNRLQIDERLRFIKSLYNGENLIEIYSFSLMPNHFHILAKQLHDEGIKLFMSQIQNSYAKYFNVKKKRSGALFQEMFKAVRIESDEQFVHVARYIHLNPLTSYVLREPSELENYPWTSFIDYMGKRTLPFLNRSMLMSHYPTTKKLKKFTMDQVDHQRKLKEIKHLMLE